MVHAGRFLHQVLDSAPAGQSCGQTDEGPWFPGQQTESASGEDSLGLPRIGSLESAKLSVSREDSPAGSQTLDLSVSCVQEKKYSWSPESSFLTVGSVVQNFVKTWPSCF